jgi:hypothetical protein
MSMNIKEIVAAALVSAVVFIVALPAQNGGVPLRKSRGGRSIITGLSFSNWFNYGACPHSPKWISADTFFNTWGDDGTIYVQCNDTYLGWQGAGNYANICFGSVDGYTSSLTGTGINYLPTWGGVSQFGSDGATYKSTSLTSIHGTLYMVADRQKFASAPGDGWLSSQLIKSTNHGVSWTPVPPAHAQPYASPMFTDPKFRVPFFVQYGQDYVGQTVDRSGDLFTPHRLIRPRVTSLQR